jgi:thiamine biosynthesis lipoprotein
MTGKIHIFFITILIPFLFLSCSLKKKNIYTDSRISMDTVVSISVVSGSASDASWAINLVFGEIEKLTDLLNFYSDKSELSMINKSSGKKPVKVSPETLDIIKEAITVARQTGGAFDPTVGVISSLWDFNNKIKPEKDDIKERLKLVSYKNIVINENKGTVFLKKEGMMIDLGGISKGYAADIAVDILASSGIEAALVSVAGDIRAYGLKPDGTPWMIGIKDPRPRSSTENILAALPLKDMAISTSGDYQRFFEKEGMRYHHILVPQNGMPARGCQSVSVISDSSLISDSLSTAVFILGAEKGMKLLVDLGYNGVIVDSRGKLHISEGLKDEIEIKRPQK